MGEEMKCPHCGKETDVNIVQRWRESFVQECGHVYQLEDVTSLPSPLINTYSKTPKKPKYNNKHGGPPLVIVSEVKK
jgi:uncharacterized Zn finger protein